LFEGRDAQTLRRNLIRSTLFLLATFGEGDHARYSPAEVRAERLRIKGFTAAALTPRFEQLLRPHQEVDEGHWRAVTVDGHPTQFFRQLQTMECGPSCVSMILRLKNRGADQSITRGHVGRIGHGPSGDIHDFNRAGSDLDWLTRALADQGVPAHSLGIGCTLQRYEKHLFEWGTFSREKPGILRVQWDDVWDGTEWVDGGGHFVVCLGPPAGQTDRVNILDPYSAHGLIVYRRSAFPRYTPPYGGAGNLDNKWSVTTGNR
jgi:hypothetical protein